MLDQPRITVLIPTRERCDVLEKALATIVSQDYPNLEIVVSDNASADATRDVASSTGDPRVRYLNTGKRVSMTENWELALSQVTGGWVTIVGDDDGLAPGALTRVAKLMAANTRAIRSEACRYEWPSPAAPVGRLCVPTGQRTELRDSREWLARVLRGDASYLELPMLYNGGFVRADVLEELRGKNGTVLRSCIPDVYSAVAIASVTDHYLFSHEPLAISGASRHSTGSSLFSPSKEHPHSAGRLFRSEGNLPLHADMAAELEGVFPLSIHALVYECYLQSAFLRPPRLPIHAEQLEVILGEEAHNEETIAAWAEVFARKHAFDLPRIYERAQRRARRSRVPRFARRLQRALRTHVLDGSEATISNVQEAALVVAAIRATPPTAATLAQRTAMRALHKLRARIRPPAAR